MDDKTVFAWLIEMQGPAYLAARKLGGHEFYWTGDVHKAIQFVRKHDADVAMMAIRELVPDLFPACLVRPASPVEHGFVTLHGNGIAECLTPPAERT